LNGLHLFYLQQTVFWQLKAILKIYTYFNKGTRQSQVISCYPECVW